MKERMAELLKTAAVKTAKRSVGKSAYMGVHEIEVPKVLLEEVRKEK